MGKAQREEHIGIGLAKDMGHVVIVAHDLDRPGQPARCALRHNRAATATAKA
jgi:hypothetical protein